MIEIIANIGIFVFGQAAVRLVGRKNRWGFVFGLASQPCWFYIGATTGQWGILAVSVLYTANWATGAYSWFVRDPRRRAAPATAR
jgi:nicotinamide riboside transporter PnuC